MLHNRCVPCVMMCPLKHGFFLALPFALVNKANRRNRETTHFGAPPLILKFGEQVFDCATQILRAGQQAVMVEQPPDHPRAVGADAGHRLQPRKIGFGHPVHQIAKRAEPRCRQPLPQPGGQDGSPNRQIVVGRVGVG